MHFATKKRTETNQNELTLFQIRNNCAKLPINMCKLQRHTCRPDLFDALDLFEPRPDQKAPKTKATYLRVWLWLKFRPFIVLLLCARCRFKRRPGSLKSKATKNFSQPRARLKPNTKSLSGGLGDRKLASASRATWELLNTQRNGLGHAINGCGIITLTQ